MGLPSLIIEHQNLAYSNKKKVWFIVFLKKSLFKNIPLTLQKFNFRFYLKNYLPNSEYQLFAAMIFLLNLPEIKPPFIDLSGTKSI